MNRRTNPIAAPAIEPHEIRCMRCGAAAIARVATAALGPMRARWLQPPAGWWVLLANDGVHCRCPACLAGSKGGARG